jgi:hypothetical protein
MNPIDQNRIIEMAWEDRPPFEAILFQFALIEADVIALMRKSLHQGLCALQQAIHLEEKMGKGLSRSKMLQ